MKKYLKSVVILLLIALLSVSPVCAEGDSMQAQWRGDYTNMNLVLTVKSPVDYIQNVTVLMYPKGAAPGFDTYCRVDEVTLDGKNEKEILIKLSDDLNAPDGEYTVVLQGNGAYDTEKNSAAIDVCVMSPYDVGILLNQINGVVGDTDESLETLKGYMEKAAAILKLEGVDSAASSQLKTIVNIRNIDFKTNGNKFLSLNDVEKAWRSTGLIEYLLQEAPVAAQLETEYTALSDILSVNVSDDDYTKVKTALYNNIISMKTSFNDGKGVQAIKDAESIFNQAKAVAVVNISTVDEMEAVVEKYTNVLGIDNEVYSDFSGYSTTEKEKILRQLTEKNFATAEAVKTAFTTAVSGSDGGSDSGSSDSDDDGSSSKGNTGKPVGSLGGVTNGSAAAVQTPSAESVFSDLNTSHWAYAYVNGLKNDGIISGYSDGNFYPNNSVKREEFVKMVVLAADMYSEGENCTFDDVYAGEWYYPYIASASQAGLVNGIGDSVFGTGMSITREDVAVIVNRILTKSGAVSESGSVQGFTDSDKISSYAAESVGALSGIGILNGFEDGSFKPQANLTRAEAAKIIFMLKEYIKK